MKLSTNRAAFFQPLSVLLILFALAVQLFTAPRVQSAEPESGFYVRNGFSSFTAPVANQTWVFNITDGRVYGWDGSNWQLQTAGKVQNAGVGAPGTSNDSTQNYSIGSLWFDATAGHQWYICTSNTASAATWSIFTGRASQADINTSIQSKATESDSQGDYVATGLLGSVPSSSLTMTTPAGVAYVTGLRLAPSSSSFAYTANKDTYDYLQTNGSINHIPVTNGAGAPVGQTGLNIQKVVSGSVITSVTQIAFTAPVTNVATAVASTLNAINISQADSRYTMASVLSGGANQFLATPNGSSGTASLRAIVSADLPIIGTSQGGLGGSVTPTLNSLLVGTGTNFIPTAAPSAGLLYVRSNAGNTALEWAASVGIGSLTMAGPSGLMTWSAPLTVSGTMTATLATQTANTVFAGPTSGSAATPAFRALALADLPGLFLDQGRIYCVTGQSTAPSSGASSALFFGPTSIENAGNVITLPNAGGTAFVWQTFGETAITMSGLTTGTLYDVYIASASSTTITTSTAAWTGNTPPTRGTLNNIVTDSTHTKLWVGAFEAVSATTTRDDATEGFVSNAYNQVQRRLYAQPTGNAAITPASSAAFSAWQASSTDGVARNTFIQCLANQPVMCRYQGSVNYGTAGAYAGIGVNSNTVASVSAQVQTGTSANNVSIGLPYSFNSTVGQTFLSALYAGTTSSWYPNETALGGIGSSPLTYMETFIWN